MSSVSRTKDEIFAAMEALMVEYLSTDSQLGAVMLTGFVFKVSGRAYADDGEVSSIDSFGWPPEQDLFLSLGLCDALKIDATNYYASVMSEDDSA